MLEKQEKYWPKVPVTVVSYRNSSRRTDVFPTLTFPLIVLIGFNFVVNFSNWRIRSPWITRQPLIWFRSFTRKSVQHSGIKLKNKLNKPPNSLISALLLKSLTRFLKYVIFSWDKRRFPRGNRFLFLASVSIWFCRNLQKKIQKKLTSWQLRF